MAQVSLQRAGIGPLVCQRVAAGVAQHVGMNLEVRTPKVYGSVGYEKNKQREGLDLRRG